MGDREPFNPDHETFVKHMEAILPRLSDFLAKEIVPAELAEKDRQLWQAFVWLLSVETSRPLLDIASYRAAVVALKKELSVYRPGTHSSSGKFAHLLNNDIMILEADCDFYDPTMPDLSGIDSIKKKYNQ